VHKEVFVALGDRERAALTTDAQAIEEFGGLYGVGDAGVLDAALMAVNKEAILWKNLERLLRL
jgi:hypothetical protein